MDGPKQAWMVLNKCVGIRIGVFGILGFGPML